MKCDNLIWYGKIACIVCIAVLVLFLLVKLMALTTISLWWAIFPIISFMLCFIVIQIIKRGENDKREG